MSNVERYKTIITAAFEAKQLQIELRRKLAEIGENITVSELKSRDFKDKDAFDALGSLANGTIDIWETPDTIVSIFKDVEIALLPHAHPYKLQGDSVTKILEGLSNNDILEALR